MHRPVYCLYVTPFLTTGGAENHGLLNIINNNNSKLAFCYIGMAALSTLPLNRPATVEGSEGKGAWCERCWATDTGPQKESDATGSRKEDKEEKERTGRRKRANKKAFQGQAKEEVTVIQAGRRHLTQPTVLERLNSACFRFFSFFFNELHKDK